MKTIPHILRSKVPYYSAAVVAGLLAVSVATAQPVSTGSAQQDFETLKVAARPLEFGPAPAGATRTADDFAKQQKLQSAGFVAAAKQANAFYTKYPNDPNAGQARKIEAISLLRAVNTGTAEVEPQAVRLANAFRADKSNSSADRYEVAMNVLQHDVVRKNIVDKKALLQEYHDRAMDLYGEFPNEPALFSLLIGVAQNADPELARSTAKQILLIPAPDAIKQQAQAVIDRLDMPGKNVAFEWQDENGKSYQMSDFKGRIVVFYVWATWTPATSAANAAVSAALKPGVQLVSVNVDTDPAKGKTANAAAKLGGINYYDNRGLQGPLTMQLKAIQVPSVYVVDANGVFVGAGTAFDLPHLLANAAGI
jgi:hypothetical protein